ncbi:HIT family protein [Macrococcus caseolyticus]|nr:HIT family protein [Macrococcus caseolyticus]MDJ1156404.1 HIT family protein [Macrococcus caseolyticus]
MCIFCEGISENQKLLETQYFYVVYDIDPIQYGHLLIISNNHFEDIRDLEEDVCLELFEIEKYLISILEDVFKVDGVTIVRNNGNIMDEGLHFHQHIIPCYERDGFWDNVKTSGRKIDTRSLKNKIQEYKKVME